MQARQLGVPAALLTAEMLDSVQPGKLALSSPELEIEPWHNQLVLSSSRYSQRIRTLPLPLGNSNTVKSLPLAMCSLTKACSFR